MRWTIQFVGLVAVLMFCSSFSLKGAVATPNETAPDTLAIEKAIKQIYAEMTKAAESVDADKLYSYVLDNEKGCQVSNGTITLTRQKAMEDYKNNSRNIAGVVYAMDRQYVTVISPKTAVMVVEGRYDATTSDGRTFGSPMAQTVVFVLKENGWKVLHSHTSTPVNR
jgi:ketosteroid isomerase-like protein